MKNNVFLPNVTERTSEGVKSSDLFSRLLEDRIILLNGEVDETSCNLICAQLLYLNNTDKKKPIYMYISSPGGSVVHGLGQVIDIMNLIEAPVYTIATSMAASMGAAILSAGEPGHRYCLPSSQILCHPMSGGSTGRTADNIIENNYEKRLENYLMATIAHNCHRMSDESFNEIRDVVSEMDDTIPYPKFKLSKTAKKELDAFKKASNYDHWMFPKEALKFGIIDEILESRKVLNV